MKESPKARRSILYSIYSIHSITTRMVDYRVKPGSAKPNGSQAFSILEPLRLQRLVNGRTAAMQAETEPNQPWRIQVRAKAKRFDFELEAAKLSPAWRLHRIRVLLHIHKLFFFLLNSKSGHSYPNQPRRALRSRFLGAFEKFCSIFAKRPRNRRKSRPRSYLDRFQFCATEAPINYITLVFVAAVLGFALRNSMYLKYVLAILLLTAHIFMKKREASKSSKLFALLPMAIVVAFCFVSSDLYSHYYCVKKVESFYSRWVWYWKIWKFVGSKVLDAM